MTMAVVWGKPQSTGVKACMESTVSMRIRRYSFQRQGMKQPPTRDRRFCGKGGVLPVIGVLTELWLQRRWPVFEQRTIPRILFDVHFPGGGSVGYDIVPESELPQHFVG